MVLSRALNTSRKLEVMSSSPPPSQEGPLCSVVPSGIRSTEDFPQAAPLPWRSSVGWDQSAWCIHIHNIFLVDRLTVVWSQAATWVYWKGGSSVVPRKRRCLAAVSPNVPCVSRGRWLLWALWAPGDISKQWAGSQPVQMGTVTLKSALSQIWLEKMASPFLLGMENVFPEHSFNAWTSGYGLKSSLFSPSWLSTLVYGWSHN